MSSGCFPTEQKDSDVKLDDATLRHLGQWREDVISMLRALESRCVHMDVLFTTRQTIETWQKGCEVQINNILSALQTNSEHHGHHKNRIDSIKGAIEYFIKRLDEVTDRVTYLEQQHTQEKFNLPSVGELNKIVDKELKKDLCCDSKQHIERLKEIVNETLKIKRLLHDENKELLSKNNLLADCLDRKQAEINRLERRMNELVNKFNKDNGGHL